MVRNNASLSQCNALRWRWEWKLEERKYMCIYFLMTIRNNNNGTVELVKLLLCVIIVRRIYIFIYWCLNVLCMHVFECGNNLLSDDSLSEWWCSWSSHWTRWTIIWMGVVCLCVSELLFWMTVWSGKMKEVGNNWWWMKGVQFSLVYHGHLLRRACRVVN